MYCSKICEEEGKVRTERLQKGNHSQNKYVKIEAELQQKNDKILK